MRYFVFITNLILAACFAAFGQSNDAVQTSGTKCPGITVISPGSPISAGDSAEFNTKLIDSNGFDKYEYSWSASKGIIESGQGTPTISVRTMRDDAGTSLSVTLRIKGIASGCSNEASNAVGVIRVQIIDYDHFGRLNRYQMRAVIENLFIEINHYPNSKGLIIFRFDELESRKEKLARLNMILSTIRFRKYDASRLTIAISKKASGLEYTPLVLPAGKEFPVSSDEYFLFKCEDLLKDIRAAFAKPNSK